MSPVILELSSEGSLVVRWQTLKLEHPSTTEMPFLRGVLRVLCVATVLSSAAAALPEDAWARPLDSSSQHDKAATKSATLSSLLDLPYIRSKFINALPEWLHHRQASELPRAPPRDAATRELHFFTTEDTPMQVRGHTLPVAGGHDSSCR